MLRLLGAILCFVFMSCSKSDLTEVIQPNPLVTPNPIKPENVVLGCGSAGDFCDGSVGILFHLSKVAGNNAMFRCTASLVGPKTLLTNWHCIPEGKRYIGAILENTYFRQPDLDSNSRGQLVQVTEVVATDLSGEPGAPDYALVELKEVIGGPNLSVFQEGFSLNQKVSILGVNHWSDQNSLEPSGDTIYELDLYTDCQVIDRTFVFPYSHQRENAVIAFKDCPILGGNSGGPILDSEGRLVGTIHAKFMNEHAVSLFLNSEISLLRLSYDDYLNEEIALGSNAICFRSYRGEVTLDDSNCSPTPFSAEPAVFTPFFSRSLKQAWLKSNGFLHGDDDGYFLFSPVSKESPMPVISIEQSQTPLCYFEDRFSEMTPGQELQVTKKQIRATAYLTPLYQLDILEYDFEMIKKDQPQVYQFFGIEDDGRGLMLSPHGQIYVPPCDQSHYDSLSNPRLEWSGSSRLFEPMSVDFSKELLSD